MTGETRPRTTRPTVASREGMVASGHPLATAAALDVLRDGGTAADAAVAAAAVCAVVLPHRTSIGGDLFALAFDHRTGRVDAYNGSGAAPTSVRADLFPGGFPKGGVILATVPGCVAGWEDLLAGHGRFGLDRLLAPAIRIAEDGYRVSAGLADALSRWGAKFSGDPEGARLFLPGGRPLQAGDVLRQPDLAWSLRRIADHGAADFYRGELAERLVNGSSSLGGALTLDDMAQHATEKTQPLSIRYRDLSVLVPPPVSLGFVLLEELAILDGIDLSEREWGDAELVHVMVEAKKVAFADRDRAAGDPRLTGFDARDLLGTRAIAARRSRIGPFAADPDAGIEAGATDTTYLAVVDRERNVVSLIESIFNAFGAAAVVPATGIVLNDRLAGFSLDPRSPNALAPRKRPMHTLNPVLVTQNGRPKGAFGTPARDAQVQTNFQIAVGLIDFDMDVQEVIEWPRWRHDTGRRLQLEGRAPVALREALAAKGHEVEMLEDWSTYTGGVQAIWIDDDGGLRGGADPRREGVAAGI